MVLLRRGSKMLTHCVLMTTSAICYKSFATIVCMDGIETINKTAKTKRQKLWGTAIFRNEVQWLEQGSFIIRWRSEDFCLGNDQAKKATSQFRISSIRAVRRARNFWGETIYIGEANGSQNSVVYILILNWKTYIYNWWQLKIYNGMWTRVVRLGNLLWSSFHIILWKHWCKLIEGK